MCGRIREIGGVLPLPLLAAALAVALASATVGAAGAAHAAPASPIGSWLADEGKSHVDLQDANTLRVHGYVGIALPGKTQIWTRLPG